MSISGSKQSAPRRHLTSGTAPERCPINRLAVIEPQPAARTAADLPLLVERAVAGDAHAFEALYRATTGRIFAVCLRMTADRERAVELTQDVYVRVWEKLATFRGESAVESWMHRIAVNVVLESERSASRRVARVESRTDLAEVEAARGAAFTVSHDDERMDLEAAIAALPPATRRAFVLHDIEGYRHEEISQLTGTAQGTLRAQLFKARRMLMEALSR